MTRYPAPGDADSVVSYKPRYDHFIGGEYVSPVKGQRASGARTTR